MVCFNSCGYEYMWEVSSEILEKYRGCLIIRTWKEPQITLE